MENIDTSKWVKVDLADITYNARLDKSKTIEEWREHIESPEVQEIFKNMVENGSYRVNEMIRKSFEPPQLPPFKK